MENNIKYLLELVADRRNWQFSHNNYDPYGNQIYINEWIGSEDIWEVANDILVELEDKSIFIGKFDFSPGIIEGWNINKDNDENV